MSRITISLLVAFGCIASLGSLVLARGGSNVESTNVPISVDTIDAADLALSPRGLQDLTGVVPGLAQTSGTNAGSSNITIRGVGSDFTSGVGNPLVVVDGVPISGGLEGVSPDDIKSIEILKGAAAATLYGSRATNGVVFLTTNPGSALGDGTRTAASAGNPELYTALDLYGQFSSGFSGSVDFNTLCNFGSGQVLPGWAHSPWLGGYGQGGRVGDNFFIPYGDALPSIIPTEIPPEPREAGDSPGTDQPPAPDSAGTGDSGGTGDENGGQTDAPAGNGGASNAGAPAKPEPSTPLQQWDRGVPPWSLVERSPEVAHLLEELRPIYELRMKSRDQMSLYGDWTLSDWKLRENKADYDAAEAIWRDTRRQILTLLTPFIAPEVAATAQTGDPSWADAPAAQASPATAAASATQAPRSGWTSPSLGLALGVDVDWTKDYYLTTERQLESGATGRIPAIGAALTPVTPYGQLLPLPYAGGLPDTELNSDLGSSRGFADETGRVRYGEFQPDPYLLSPKYSQPQGGGSIPDYDTRFRLRLDAPRSDYDFERNNFNFPDKFSPRPKRSLAYPPKDFDATRHQFGYSLKDDWTGYSLQVTPYDSATVKFAGQDYESSMRHMSEYLDRAFAKGSAGPKPYLSSSWNIGGDQYLSITRKGSLTGLLADKVPGQQWIENNSCATEAFPVLSGTVGLLHGKRVHDQWAIRRIGFTQDDTSAWKQIAPDATPVVVAVIDTGLDYHHYDLDWKNIWRNPGEIPGNGIDDDDNGYVDDIIGWDFLEFSNTPWDYDGHGTFVSGLIAARAGNRAGIDGINPNARIMVLKALNNFGHTRASWLSQAIVYAVENGARIINMSAAGPGLPRAVQDALDYADRSGVLVVVAAGNAAEDVDKVSPAGLEHAITVAATDLEDQRAEFSNWGKRVDIAAPGMHVMSLRARETDFRLTSADTPYKRGAAIAGLDRRYYRADGTSFAAPLVTAVASLIWSNNPALTHVQVRRMLEQSARDIDTPGRDQFTGYGLLDARAALAADPDDFVQVQIDAVSVASVQGKPVAQVAGTADANAFARAWVEVGRGENPESWQRIGEPLKSAVRQGLLGNIPATALQGSPVWIIRVITEHSNGSRREARYRLNIG